MKQYARYVIGVLLLLFALVLIVLGFNLIRSIFKSDSNKPPSQTAKSVKLEEAAQSGKAVQYTIDGNVVGKEEHRTIKISIDNKVRRVEVLEGYNGEIIKSQETINSPEAYKAFTSALSGAGFTSSRDPKGRGVEAQSCPLGRKFSYEVSPGASDAFRAWSTSCSKKEGTFTGNSSLVQTLFKLQIPDYNNFTRDAKLNF